MPKVGGIVLGFLGRTCFFLLLGLASLEVGLASEPRVADTVDAYIDQVLELSHRYRETLSMQFEWPYEDNVSPLQRHHGPRTTAYHSVFQEPDTLTALKWMASAGLIPWAMAGFAIAPMETAVLWLGLPVLWAHSMARTIARWRRPAPISVEHYDRMTRYAEYARHQSKIQSWDASTFVLFENLIAGRVRRIYQGFNDTVATLHDRGMRPKEATIQRLIDDYLLMWSLTALYEIESARFLSLFIGIAHRDRVDQLRLDLSHNVIECRVALTRMSNYRW